ncbi:MAG: hypothetical protein K8J08_06355 [Thermoanaerobaculia bacterium]|nr:hypothetical protein [Thermoanaerobaculia bacterium]
MRSVIPPAALEALVATYLSQILWAARGPSENLTKVGSRAALGAHFRPTWTRQ